MKLRREVFAALRYAPARQRYRLARAIMALSESVFDLPPSIAADCKIKSLDQFESVCHRLGLALGLPGKTPAPEQIINLKSLEKHRFYPGVIGRLDQFFLTAFVSVLAPERILELGTLTGFSAALLALAAIAQRGYQSRPVVETIDSATECMVAPEPIGFEIPRLLPGYPAAVRLHTGRDARFVAELFAPGELSLAFIDANHSHPFPLLDVLRLAPFMASDGWLMLHDISLGTIGQQMLARGEPLQYGAPFGAEWLFQAWPFPRIYGGNTGAIQLPKDSQALLPFALDMMRRPFEGGRRRQHRELRRMLYQAMAALVPEQ
jgi:hypothetical protein